MPIMIRPIRRIRPRQLVAVVMAMIAVFASSFAFGSGFSSAWSSVPTALLVVAAMAAIALSVWMPRWAAIASIAVFAVGTALQSGLISFTIALLVTLFSVAVQTDRRASILFGVLALLGTGPAAYFFSESTGYDARSVLQLFAFIGFSVAAGDAARSRRAVIDSLEERTRRAEETAESEARRRIAEERVRIARDLHDVMAHQIAIINLHSSVASQAVRQRPDDAERSLVIIRDAARTVLGEIGSLLNVLRAGGSSTMTLPTPGIEMLDGLLGDFSLGGLDVDLREVGERLILSPTSDIVAYRVIQEALTNAQKHGGGSSALLYLDWTRPGLEVTVTNSVGPRARGAADPPIGHGLVGVRERVHSVGGTVEVTMSPGDVHRFVAWVPLGTSSDRDVGSGPGTGSDRAGSDGPPGSAEEL